MKPTITPDLAGGIYTPRRAGALAGVSGQRIGQWARRGLITPNIYRGRPTNLYAYFDVAEAIVVRWLLDKGFSHADVRGALDSVRHEHPQWPLLRGPLGVGQASLDDRGLLVRKEGDHYVDVTGGSHGQIVIRPQLLDRARDMLLTGGWIASAHGLERIEVTPGKLGGQPSIRGRRWTVDHVARLAADEDGRQVLIDDYRLAPQEVDEAVVWHRVALELA